MLRIIGVVDRILSLFENWTLFIAVMVGLVSLFVNVVLRYGFNHSLAWSEELIRLIIIYTTFIGSAAAIKNRSMITIDALPQLAPRLKMPLTFLGHAAALVFSVIICNLGWQMMVQQAATGQTTIVMGIPMALLFAMLPLMGGLMFIRTLIIAYQDALAYFAPKTEG